MLRYTEDLLGGHPSIKERIQLIHSLVQDFATAKSYDLIMSNSLLHHLQDPSQLWVKIKELSHAGTYVCIMDLIRPASVEEARELVRMYAAEEPEILSRDFYNSLLAAFTINEVREQLEETGFGNLEVERVSDRHLIVFGKL